MTAASNALTLLSAQASDSGASASVTEVLASSKKSDTTNFDYSAGQIHALISKAQDYAVAKQEAEAGAAIAAEKAANLPEELHATVAARYQESTAAMSVAFASLSTDTSNSEETKLAFFASISSVAQAAIATSGIVLVHKMTDGDDSLNILSASTSNVSTYGGNDEVVIKSNTVSNVDTGSGNDAIAIAAEIADDVYGGSGHDAVAINAEIAANIYAGSGNDSVAVNAALVGNVDGGSGDDAISVNAVIGASQFLAAEASGIVYDTNKLGDRLLAATADYTDIDGGDGNDVISVNVQEVMTVSGGAGDDLIMIEGGTVGVQVGADSGHDTIRVAEGAELVLNTGEGGFSVIEEGDDLIVMHAGGSVRIEDYQNAGTIAIGGSTPNPNGGGVHDGAAAAGESEANVAASWVAWGAGEKTGQSGGGEKVASDKGAYADKPRQDQYAGGDNFVMHSGSGRGLNKSF